MDLFAALQVWHLIVSLTVVTVGWIVSVTKLYGRVGQLEKDLEKVVKDQTDARVREEALKTDLVQIKVSLARIETTLEELKEQKRHAR